MDKTKISNVDYSVERPTESCVPLRPGDTKCVFCGRDSGYPARSCHAGPNIAVVGIFEMAEWHDPMSDVWHGLRLYDFDDRLDAKQNGVAAMPIVVTGCASIVGRGWRYEFSGSMAIEVPRIA